MAIIRFPSEAPVRSALIDRAMMVSLRWKKLGGQLWIDPDITLKHWGLHGWRGNQHEQWIEEKRLLEQFPPAVAQAAE